MNLHYNRVATISEEKTPGNMKFTKQGKVRFFFTLQGRERSENNQGIYKFQGI